MKTSTNLKRYCKPLMSLGRHGRFILLLLFSTSSIIHFHHEIILCYRAQQIFIKHFLKASPVVQWLRIYLSVQGVQYLIQEDFTSHTANRPVCSDFWTYVLRLQKPMSAKACAPHQQRPPQREACAQLESSPGLLQLEKALTQQWRPSTAKNK